MMRRWQITCILYAGRIIRPGSDTVQIHSVLRGDEVIAEIQETPTEVSVRPISRFSYSEDEQIRRFVEALIMGEYNNQRGEIAL